VTVVPSVASCVRALSIPTVRSNSRICTVIYLYIHACEHIDTHINDNINALTNLMRSQNNLGSKKVTEDKKVLRRHSLHVLCFSSHCFLLTFVGSRQWISIK
jgi:hypothetical protein